MLSRGAINDSNHVEPDAVEDLHDESPVAFVEHRDGRDDETPIHSLAEFRTSFLGGPEQVLLVLGDPGAGKTTFLWKSAEMCYHNAVGWAGTEMPGPLDPEMLAWCPVVIDLKSYSVSEVTGLLLTRLREYGIRDPERWSLPVAVRTTLLTPRLLVLCDGFDELRSDASGSSFSSQNVRPFVAQLSGGAAWDASVLKVIVTSRESGFHGRHNEELVLGRHQRCVILPFTNTKVRSQSGVGNSVAFQICLPVTLSTNSWRFPSRAG